MHALQTLLVAAGLASSAVAATTGPRPTTTTVFTASVVTTTVAAASGDSGSDDSGSDDSGSDDSGSDDSGSDDSDGATAAYMSDFSYASVSDSRTNDPAYTSSCEAQLDKYYNTKSVPIPTNAQVMSFMEGSPCMQSVPPEISSAVADYESSVSAWLAPISSGYYNVFSDCPYLVDYEFVITNSMFVPVACSFVTGIGYVSTAASASATATATASGEESAATGSTTATARATATGSATETGSATAGSATASAASASSSASTTASGNGSPRATGVMGAAVAAAGFLGVIAAL